MIDPVELKALLSDMDASPVKYEMGYRTSMPGSKLWALGPDLARQVLALSEEVEGWRMKLAAALGRAEKAEADAKALRQRLGEIKTMALLFIGGESDTSQEGAIGAMRRIAALAAIQDGKEPQRRVVDGPACPTCGFRIVRKEKPPFIIEDDQP